MGIVAADSGAWITLVAIAILLTGLAILFQRKHRPSWFIWLATAILTLFFAGRQAGQINQLEQFPLAASLSSNESVEVSGIGWICQLNPESTRARSAVIQLEQLTVAGHPIPTNHRLPAWIQNPPDDLVYGNRLAFSGLLLPLNTASAPGAFNPSQFFQRQHNSPARIQIRPGDKCEILSGKSGSLLVSWARQLRHHLENGLISNLSPEDEPYGRLIAAMTLGARENSPEDLEDWYRMSGTMHLFAVSGLHVGIIAGVLLFLALAFRLPKRWAVLIIIPLIIFYAILTGLRPSAVRAAIMLSIVLASFAVKEQPRLLNSLSLAALVLLALNPQQLFLPGFQLSFVVLFSIIVLGEATRKTLAAPWLSDPFIPRSLLSPTRRFKDQLVGVVTAALAVSLVSWLGSVLPLSWHFDSVAPVGIVANLIMVPLASLLVVLAVTSFGCFGIHLTWISGGLNHLNVGLASLLTALAQFFATLPGAHLNTGGASPPPPQTIVSMDVMGQRGDLATLLEIHENSSLWMIDCGSPGTYRREMLPLLRHRGINHLDGLFLTHGDQGHLGAAPLVLGQLEPPLIFEPPGENRAAVYPQLISLADSLGTSRQSLSSGQRLSLSPDLKIQVLAPPPDAPGRFADDRVLILRLTNGPWSILLTSDAGFETEKRLLESGTSVQADLWIRGQHRDSPSGLAAFAEAVNPRAVISTHADFPSAERFPSHLRDFLSERSIPLFTLDQTGVINLQLSQSELKISPFMRPESGISLTPE